MKDLPIYAKIYILITLAIGVLLIAWQFSNLNWQDLGLYALAGLAALAQVLKVNGPTDRSNYNISWLVYGFSFMLLGAPAALFVILVAHLVEWVWHRYPWYIQTFNIAVYAVAITAAGLVYRLINPGLAPLQLQGGLAILAAILTFTLTNHLMVGLVIKLARGQSLKESGVFDPLTLTIDFTLLGMGMATALLWTLNPFIAFFNVIPLYLIYNTLKVPALKRQIKDLERNRNVPEGEAQTATT